MGLLIKSIRIHEILGYQRLTHEPMKRGVQVLKTKEKCKRKIETVARLFDTPLRIVNRQQHIAHVQYTSFHTGLSKETSMLRSKIDERASNKKVN